MAAKKKIAKKKKVGDVQKAEDMPWFRQPKPAARAKAPHAYDVAMQARERYHTRPGVKVEHGQVVDPVTGAFMKRGRPVRGPMSPIGPLQSALEGVVGRATLPRASARQRVRIREGEYWSAPERRMEITAPARQREYELAKAESKLATKRKTRPKKGKP